MSPAEKHQQLQKILGEVRSAVVAFSGGVDSTYLLYEAAQVLEKVLAVTVSSPLVPPAEVEEAGRTAARLGVPWEAERTLSLSRRRHDIRPKSGEGVTNPPFAIFLSFVAKGR